MEDHVLEAAIAAYVADHPDPHGIGAARLRRLNREAHDRAAREQEWLRQEAEVERIAKLDPSVPRDAIVRAVQADKERQLDALRRRQDEAAQRLVDQTGGATLAPPRPTGQEPRWRDIDRWTREDFFRAIEWDRAHAGTGSKGSIAHRVRMPATTLYRRWERVRSGKEPWPSGNNGPADRQRTSTDT
jgi:hypothetical protein